MEENPVSLDTLCASLCHAMGIVPPSHATASNPALDSYIENTLRGQKADRVFMYNPDAIGQWLYEKYPHFLQFAKAHTELELPMQTVMPSVTPVCFATMYTGAQPEVHGIQKYEKPVLTLDTIFDALIRAGKKPVIVAHKNASLAHIYLQRDMDYFIYDSPEKVIAKAAQIVLEDRYDFVVVYNGSYDYIQHRFGPESPEALAELRVDGKNFATFSAMIQEHWRSHNTLLGFAMDHGCHAINDEDHNVKPGYLGTHGRDIPEDMNIVHLYKALPKA